MVQLRYVPITVIGLGYLVRLVQFIKRKNDGAMPNRRSNAAFNRTVEPMPVRAAIVFKGRLVESKVRAASSLIVSTNLAGVCPVASTNFR